jgi:hypothetical protein
METTVLFNSLALRVLLNRARRAASGSFVRNVNPLSKLPYPPKTDSDIRNKSYPRPYCIRLSVVLAIYSLLLRGKKEIGFFCGLPGLARGLFCWRSSFSPGLVFLRQRASHHCLFQSEINILGEMATVRSIRCYSNRADHSLSQTIP